MASSGSLTWGPITSGSYYGAKFVFYWSTQSTTATTTTISWKVKGEGRSSSPTCVASAYYLYLDGQVYATKESHAGAYPDDSFQDYTHDSGTYTITHNTDGSGSFTAILSAWITTATPEYSNVELTFTLDALAPQGYTITAYAGSGISSVTGGGTYEEGANATLTATVADGYDWGFWYITPNGNEDDMYSSTDNPYTLSNITMPYSATAHGTPHGNTLTINPNGGTMFYDSSEETSDSFDVKFQYNYGRLLGSNNPWYYTTIGEPQRTGCDFTGWNVTSGGGSVILYSPGDDLIGVHHTDDFDNMTLHTDPAYYFDGKYDGDVTVTAQWDPHEFTITYNPGEGTGTMSDSSHDYINESNLTTCTFEKSGYSFLGWNTMEDGSGNTYVDGDDARKVAEEQLPEDGGNITLYAQWGIKGIKFYYNGEWVVGRVKIYYNGAWY